MSIKLKVSLAMGTLIVLLMIVGGSASVLTGRLADTFSEYRITAQSSVLLGSLEQELYKARVASLEFRTNGGQANIDEFREHMDAIAQTSARLNELARTDELASSLTAIPDLVGA